jgi:hypothetical protein
METKLTSRDIIEAYHRIGEIMDLAGLPDIDTAALDALDTEALTLLDSLGEEAPDKLGKLRAVCTHLAGEAELLRIEERRLSARRKSRERAVERVRGYAAGILSSRRIAGLSAKIKTSDGTFWLATTKSLEGPKSVGEWEEVGLSKVEVKPDRTAARKALEGGAMIDGFALVDKESIRWR